MRAERPILSSCHGEQEGPLTPHLPNLMCLSFHYVLAPASGLSHPLCWTRQHTTEFRAKGWEWNKLNKPISTLGSLMKYINSRSCCHSERGQTEAWWRGWPLQPWEKHGPAQDEVQKKSHSPQSWPHGSLTRHHRDGPSHPAPLTEAQASWLWPPGPLLQGSGKRIK